MIDQGSPVVLDCGLAATAWGEGPTVLLAHGWESRRTHWSAFVPALTAAGYRAVAIDAPAHGDSPGETSNMPLYARRMLDVGRQLGPLEGVVGHSFGAGAATMALAQGLEARRAVLIAGASTIMTYMNRWCRHNGVGESQIPLFVRMVADAVGQKPETFELTRAAAGLNVPALVMHDTTDDDVPVDDAYAMAAAWPGARLHLTERFGHRRILVARPVVAEAVRFLAARDA
jgi:pimeloyl-ACP methyl ester carboxylesterase